MDKLLTAEGSSLSSLKVHLTSAACFCINSLPGPSNLGSMCECVAHLEAVARHILEYAEPQLNHYKLALWKVVAELEIDELLIRLLETIQPML